MRILSLQSWVAYGHVGNAAAIFPLQRLGAEVLAIHTAQLANHKGYPDAVGEATAPATIAAIMA
ncbi:MAG: pyridoxal kinase, partial [Acetobacteraceae bacterium]